MILDEATAKTKWCPFARAVGYLSDSEGLVDTSSNRHPDPTIMEQVRCLASECMSWRWANDPDGEAAYRRTPVKDAPGHHDNAPLGYCGLSGKPEA